MQVKRVIYPPIWLVLGLVAVFGLNEFLPGPRFSGVAAQVVGGAMILAGLVLLVLANGLFTRAGTDVIPFRNVSALVTNGVYRFTRNPMYLGMLLVLLGCAVTVGSVYALVIPPLFAGIVQVRFIRAEEALLHSLFGDEYAAYCQRVRRWL
ncbi:MAG: isoprenylcysteine carboxylmethyltransferase family protein [Halioglobus sp.]|nr:isoprenylcysteine carboxylmethyltransferase family protein [Halioglobus sp.]